MGIRYLPAIDGLRAIAVLAVVAYHAGLPVQAGFVGVDVFFVISGYVITRMLAAEHHATGRIDFAAFYARRVRRILPALALVIAAVLAASVLLLAPDYRAGVVRSAVASAAMVANFHFQFSTGGYFDTSAEQMPLLHLWSLAVEEQFYFAWPLLLAGLYRYRARWALAGLALASFGLAQAWASGPSADVAFYQMPARFWELAVGGLIALSPARSRAAYAYAGLAVLAFAVMVPLPDFPGTGALPAVLGTALVVHAAHGGVSVVPLELAPVRYVGLISYSLYLWHWPLLAITRASSFEPPSLPLKLALCGVAAGLAALTYRFVETPFRRSRAPKFKAIALGVGTCLTLAACAGAVGASIRHDDLASRTARDFTEGKKACHAEMNSPATLPPASCGTGPVVLWGDSHAYAWRPFAEQLGAVRPMTRANCSPSAGNAHGDSCQRFNALAVKQAEQGDTVILAARWLSLFQGQRAGMTRSGLSAALAQVAPHVRRVILMGPVPVMPHSAVACIYKGRVDQCFMARADFDREAAPARAFLRAAASQYPNVEYVETAGFFCNARECPLLKDGYSLYWDDNHISASAARGFQEWRRSKLPGLLKTRRP